MNLTRQCAKPVKKPETKAVRSLRDPSSRDRTKIDRLLTNFTRWCTPKAMSMSVQTTEKSRKMDRKFSRTKFKKAECSSMNLFESLNTFTLEALQASWAVFA